MTPFVPGTLGSLLVGVTGNENDATTVTAVGRCPLGWWNETEQPAEPMESDGNRPVKEDDTGQSKIPEHELARGKKVLRRDLPRSDEELREVIGSIVDEVVARRHEADRLQADRSLAPSPPTWVRNRRRAAILAAVLALVVIAAAVGQRPRNEIIPDELVGLWTTGQAGYTGRAFRITKESLTFYTSSRDSTFHTLTRVSSRRARMARQFDIRYRGPDRTHDLSFYYLPADNVIEFRDQPGIIWVKARD